MRLMNPPDDRDLEEVSSNPVPLPDLYFDSFSYPVASFVFGDMAIVSLFLQLFFLGNPRSCLERYRFKKVLNITLMYMNIIVLQCQ